MNHFPIFNIYYSVIDIKTQFFFLWDTGIPEDAFLFVGYH